MTIQIDDATFTDTAAVLDDVKHCGTWPTTFVSGRSPGLQPHWHDHDVIAYVIEGETSFYDASTDTHLPIKAGDKVTIPRGTVHAEGPVEDRVVYILATPEPMKSKAFLRLEDPATAPELA